jgi:hypothetical protein
VCLCVCVCVLTGGVWGDADALFGPNCNISGPLPPSSVTAGVGQTVLVQAYDQYKNPLVQSGGNQVWLLTYRPHRVAWREREKEAGSTAQADALISAHTNRCTRPFFCCLPKGTDPFRGVPPPAHTHAYTDRGDAGA